VKKYLYKAQKLENLANKIKAKKEEKAKLSIYQRLKKALLS